MLILAGKLKRDDGLKESQASATASDCTRDRLLVKEVVELELHCFQPTGGKLQFETEAPDACNMVPPKVEMLAQDLEPQHHRDGRGYVSNIRLIAPGGPPMRTLKGLNSLFTDLWNFDDPLTSQAVGHHLRITADFRHQAEDYIERCTR
uniref:Uncharacterized protein n=1 Tax=Capra hircus TaxID=9925 RepID=A0A452EJ94_CAPHI